MAELHNRARMATATTGTGTLTLATAIAGYASLDESGVQNGAVVSYVLEDGNDFEIGVGTYTASGTTLSRDTVTLSKISGTAGTSKINLSGSATVFLTARAEDLLISDDISTNVQAWDAQLDSLSSSSANGVSLVTAANYAAMRALLDLEAGTDFYSIAAADAAFQPLDSDLTAIAALTTAAYGRGLLEYSSDANFKAGVNLEIGTDVQAYSAVLDRAALAMTRQAVSTASSTLNIDLSSGWHVSLSLGHTITTFTVSNAPASGTLLKLTLDITSSGTFDISDYPGTVIWVGGSAPTITDTGVDTIILTSVDGGSNWRGYVGGQDFS